ncbi:PfkB family carbohydrate kinase [Thermotoga sp. SG1]|uniref:PfkB family carbohydrate kinase n=1 Tax=Thermotoga sp. SG1 TaxID=126739 RepID=UPI000C78EA28|nr:PfkB family carbohydrate kinase [Thermotoga sp. SG1]PLV56904.1 carbohydrate kinase [Thermotoga sp. SG1]
MKIAIFGGTFWDVFLFGKDPHKTIIRESPGGSGLNVAYGLFLLGHRVDFYSNVGEDFRGKHLVDELKRSGFDVSHMSILHGKTGLFIARNGRPLAVEIGVNGENIVVPSMMNDYDLVFATGEVTEKTLKVVCERSQNVVIDIGPRARIDTSDLKALIIGNEKECSRIRCDVVKMGPEGARWHDIHVPGNGVLFSHPIGLGDLFDMVLIHELLKGRSRREALEKAVECSQILGQEGPLTPFERISRLKSFYTIHKTPESCDKSTDASHNNGY